MVYESPFALFASERSGAMSILLRRRVATRNLPLIVVFVILGRALAARGCGLVLGERGDSVARLVDRLVFLRKTESVITWFGASEGLGIP